MFTCTDCRGPIDAYNQCACNRRAPALQHLIDEREKQLLRSRLSEIERRQEGDKKSRPA